MATIDPSAGPLLSRAHPLVRRVRDLVRSADRRERDAAFVAEGVRLAEEALAESAPILDAIVGQRLHRDPRGSRLEAALRHARVRLHRAGDALLDSLSDAEAHQGILLVMKRPALDVAEFTARPPGTSRLVIAVGVQDPGNLGALVRLADASGASGLMAAGGADPFGPKAVRASAGSIFRLPVSREQRAGDAAPLVARLKHAGWRLAAAVARGGRDPRSCPLEPPLALLLGTEGAGLDGELLRLADLKLSIPMSPRVESINVAAAAAVILFEMAARASHDSNRSPQG